MQYKQQSGFTLIELIVVLAIAAILAAIGTPSFSNMLSNMRHSSVMSQLANDLNRARGEAIKRNQRVLVCVRSTNSTCGTGTNWQNGWLVCYDGDQDGACDNTSSTTNPNPITVHPALKENLTLTSTAAFIRFNPNGTQGTGGTATLTLGGTWAGATNKVANISGTGNISKTH